VNSARWERLEEIFHRALEARPEERAALLDAACAGDDGLRHEVEALLGNAGAAEGRLNRAVADAAAELAGVAATGLVGARLGPYRVVERLGEGGMGEAFLAEQEAPVQRARCSAGSTPSASRSRS
jgi:eukaryotic-like serine/threonine-protein kinase